MVNSVFIKFSHRRFGGVFLLVYFYIPVYHCRKGAGMIKKQINSNRGEKIASKVQTLVAEILQRNFSDDELISGVSLVGAQSHGGMQFVKLYFYSRENKDLTQKRLDEITKMVRFELAKKIEEKYVPEIRFVYDDTLERADRIEELLNNLDK